VNQPRPEEIKMLILSCLEQSASTAGLTAQNVSDDFDMLAEGVIDSLGFIRLIAELEERLGYRIEFNGLDPSELTMVGSLSRHIAAMGAHREAS
jgi:acyl carrier protein